MKKSNFSIKFFFAAFVAIGCSSVAMAQSTTASNVLSGTSATAPTQYLGSSNAFDVVLKSNNTERMRVTTTGDVGIGTTTPRERFQIGDRWTFHDGGTKYIGYNMDFNGTTNVRIVTGASSAIAFESDGACSIGTSPIGTAGTATNGTTKFYLANDGRVGIGDNAFNLLNATSGGAAISANSYRLFVEKGILTEKIKVALKSSSDWADYVFADNYHLKSLSDVEAFVKTNKHLPDVPSAQALVEDGGIDVTQMMAKQMQKIEELTLYVIELNKQNEALKAKVEALEKQ